MEGIVQMIKIDATSRIAWACHLYLVAAGALPAMKGVIYNNFTSLVLLQCILVLDKTSMIMTQIIRIIYLTHLHNLLTFFANALHSILHLLLACGPRCNTTNKCCNVWSMLSLHLAVLHSSLGVVGDSPCQSGGK